MGFGPGIAVDWSPCGGCLAAGGYAWRGRMATLGDDGVPVRVDELGPMAAGSGRASRSRAPRDSSLRPATVRFVVHERKGERGSVRNAARVPPMELSNGVCASPDGRIAYVVSRDQSIRAFDLERGVEVACGLAHVRGVKTVHASSCGSYVVTGAYDRTVMIWSADDLSVRSRPCVSPTRVCRAFDVTAAACTPAPSMESSSRPTRRRAADVVAHCRRHRVRVGQRGAEAECRPRGTYSLSSTS